MSVLWITAGYWEHPKKHQASAQLRLKDQQPQGAYREQEAADGEYPEGSSRTRGIAPFIETVMKECLSA